jgi:hypothetical protein
MLLAQPQDKVFAEYRIESLADNQILFEIGTSNLQKALHSSRGAPMVQIKLAKRAGQPCICLEARVGGWMLEDYGWRLPCVRGSCGVVPESTEYLGL